MNHENAVLIIKALDCLQARQVATAENIANANTPGYRPLRVSFEQALAAAAGQGTAAVAAVQPTVTRESAGSYNGELRLDLEMSDAASTASRYSALIDILNGEMQMRSQAITGNN
jgi:flagellar basal-body rod protein FlgB